MPPSRSLIPRLVWLRAKPPCWNWNAAMVGVRACSPRISAMNACWRALLAMLPPSLEVLRSRLRARGGGPLGAAEEGPRPGSKAALGVKWEGMPKLGLGWAE